MRVVVLEARRDDLRPVAGDEPGCVRIGGAVHFGASVGAGIHTGAVVTSSGANTPTVRSDGMCWRTRATVPCGGTSPSRRPWLRSSISVSRSRRRDAIAVAVVDLQARRLGARCLALGVLQREQPVGRRAAGLDAELLLGVVHQFFGAQQRARHRGADVDEVLADRLELEHLVERGRAEDLGRRCADELADVLDRLVGDVAVLLLGEVQQRDRRRPGLRVAPDDLLGVHDVCLVEPRHQRSTSPSTGSTLEMTATASAIKPPRSMCGMHWMLTKLGARTCMRYGVAEPSLAM